jgi:hypothetical protein
MFSIQKARRRFCTPKKKIFGLNWTVMNAWTSNNVYELFNVEHISSKIGGRGWNNLYIAFEIRSLLFKGVLSCGI